MTTENFKFFFQYNATYLRVKNALLQKEVASKLGLTRPTVGAIEEGRALGINNVYAYAMYFKVNMQDLVTRKMKPSDLKSKNPE